MCLMSVCGLLFITRYRKFALKYHPEKNKTPGVEVKFYEVAEAYDILSDRKSI